MVKLGNNASKRKGRRNRQKDELLHIRVGEELRDEMNNLITSGLFTSQTELAREAIRELILKYKFIKWNNYSVPYSKINFNEQKGVKRTNVKSRMKRNKMKK
ncbi:MAG: hypothetical protein GWP09_00880 [Nitrospiraceae bacterium]|nr:hypothetical protein [Nitrospiraceae bacterium]